MWSFTDIKICMSWNTPTTHPLGTASLVSTNVILKLIKQAKSYIGSFDEASEQALVLLLLVFGIVRHQEDFGLHFCGQTHRAAQLTAFLDHALESFEELHLTDLVPCGVLERIFANAEGLEFTFEIRHFLVKLFSEEGHHGV